ncbi:MAG: hypothetical protein CME62_07185 [Halobacteriovoraceae bacterium]|nr:hypothetical protein [Halobacteriovoraceae bacterium]|tara:strand:- start:11241 stop:13766 length:2526 start_codon:yes stop_codon:yes gene_type:complete
MLKTVFIPAIFISLITFGLIQQVTNSNSIEYYDQENYTSSSYNRYNKNTEFFSADLAQGEAGKVPLKQLTQKMEKFSVKKAPVAKKAEDKKEEKPTKEVAKAKSQKQSFSFGKGIQAKKKLIKKNSKIKKREPSQENKYQKKIDVPENLPAVNQQVYSSYIVGNQALNQQTPPSSSEPTPSAMTGGTTGSAVTITQIDQPESIETIQSEILSSGAVEAINLSIARQMKMLAPHLRQRIKNEMSAHIKKFFEDNPDYGVTLNEITKVDFIVGKVPFGVETFNEQGLIFKFPLQGSWNIKFHMNVHYENDMFKTDEDIELTLNRFKLNFPMRFGRAENGQVKIIQHYNKQLGYEMNINSSSFLITTLLEALNAFYPEFMQERISEFVDHLALDVKPLVNKTLLPLRANIPKLLNESAPVNLASVINNIDKKILDHHMQLSTVHALQMKQTTDLSWQEAYDDHSENIKGEVESEKSHLNSAYLSGLHLAALANKYRVQSRGENLAAVKKSLKGISRLFKIHNDSGLLARSIMPLDSKLAQDLIADGEQIGNGLILGELDNTPWVAYQGDGIDIDQYTAVLFGLVNTYKLVPDTSVQMEVKRLTALMVDYLIRYGFTLKEENSLLKTVHQKPKVNIWGAAKFKQMTFILAANEMIPGRYDELLPSVHDLSDAAWLEVFYLILNPVDHFKELETNIMSLSTYFDLDESLNHRTQMLKVVDMLDYYLGHHQNIFFDTLIAKIQRNKLSEKSESISKGLYNFLKRPHRLVRTNDLSSLEKVTITLATGENVTITTAPLSPQNMVLDAGFVWQNSAQVINENEVEKPKVEAIGIDATLPYWIGSNIGIF